MINRRRLARVGSITLVFLVLFGITRWGSFFRGTGRMSWADRDELRVGTNVGYPPFIIRDDAGEVSGLDAQLMQKIGEKLGKKIRMVDMSFDALLIALMQKRVDAIIGGVTVTPGRKKKFFWNCYHGGADQDEAVGMLYHDTRYQGVRSLAQLARAYPGITVTTQAGSSFEGLLEPYRDAFKIKTLGDIADIVFDIQFKKSDVCVLDAGSLKTITQKIPELATHTLDPDSTACVDGFGIGVHRGNRDLHDEIARALQELRADGTLAALYT